MSKYSKSFKLKVVQTYLSGKRGQKLVADEFNINRSQVRERVSAYKLNGEAGLTPLNSNRRYSAEFKLSVIAYRRRHHLSLPETAKHFNMASFSTLHVWEQRYNHQGIHALIDRRGDSKMKPQSKNPYVTDKPVEQMTAEELMRELQYRRTENAYLKKLDALIQQRKLAQKTKQK